LLVVSGALLVAVLASVRTIDWAWTGFAPERLWDWLELLVVPAVLAAAGVAFSRAQARSQERIAADNRREDALQSYLDEIGELLLHERKPLISNGDAATRSVARARTLTAAKELDGVRRGALLRFLYETSLILTRVPRRRHEEPVVDLEGADFSEAALDNAALAEAHLEQVNLRGSSLEHADLGGAHLSRADLSSARMYFANLSQPNTTRRVLTKPLRPDPDKVEAHSGANLNLARLSRADLRHADLSGAQLMFSTVRGANLQGATLCKADLTGADLSKANLTLADLRGADLEAADLTGAKLDQAELDGATLNTQTKVTAAQLSHARSQDGITINNAASQLAAIIGKRHQLEGEGERTSVAPEDRGNGSVSR
jgi:uncharacterized protein YjbI with pentapeptide repeats